MSVPISLVHFLTTLKAKAGDFVKDDDTSVVFAPPSRFNGASPSAALHVLPMRAAVEWPGVSFCPFTLYLANADRI